VEKAGQQESFGRGMFRGIARHLIPEGGAYDLLNYLLDDEDGSPYKRGGSAHLSSAAGTGAGGGAVGVWDGRLVGGERSVVVVTDGSGAARIYVVSEDDSTLTLVGGSLPGGAALKFTEYNGVLLVGVGPSDPLTTAPYVYGGSRKTAEYTTGTVAVTNGDRTVIGSGTSWTSNVDAGMIFLHTESGATRWNVVESVESSTTLTLRWPWPGATDASSAYTLTPMSNAAMAGANMGGCPEFVGGRILAAKASQPSQLVFTGFEDTYPVYGSVAASDLHAFAGTIFGIHGLRDTALVFTSAGLFNVRNLSFDLTDPAGNVQQTVEKIDGLVLWSQMGVQAWGNGLIVPARDGVYLVDALSRPVLLSRSVTDLYRGYVASGYRPGQAFIYRSTYCLPILDSSLAVQGWVTCKLDSGDESGFWPWTRLSAGGVRCGTVRNRGTSQPKVLGGASASGGRLTDLKWFDPAAAYKNDADGTTPTFTFESRDYPTGPGTLNTARKARLLYDLVDAASDNPALTMAVANEDGSFTTLTDTAAEGSPASKTWLFTKRGRYVRFRLTCATAAASAVIRSLEWWRRASGRD
jgi:hypothetical protein